MIFSSSVCPDASAAEGSLLNCSVSLTLCKDKSPEKKSQFYWKTRPKINVFNHILQHVLKALLQWNVVWPVETLLDQSGKHQTPTFQLGSFFPKAESVWRVSGREKKKNFSSLSPSVGSGTRTHSLQVRGSTKSSYTKKTHTLRLKFSKSRTKRSRLLNCITV